MVASGAQDGSVKVTPLVGEASTRKWKAHNGCVKGLAFDPQRKYLVRKYRLTPPSRSPVLMRFLAMQVSTGEDGLVCIWDYTTTAPGEHKVWSSDMLPHSDMKLSQLNRAVWDSTGAKLAIPTYTGVAILERDSWKEYKRLQEHKAEVIALDWSPNGSYMISSHNDNSVVVWDLSPSSRGGGGESLDRIKHQRKVIAVAWHPKRNSVALVDEDGRFTMWENAVTATGGKKKETVKDAAPRPLDEYEKQKQSVSSLFNDSGAAPAPQQAATGSSSSSAPMEAEEDLIGTTDRKAAMDRLVAMRSQAENADKRHEDGAELVDPDDATAAAGDKHDDAMDVDAGNNTPAPTAAPPVKPRQAAAAARRRPNTSMPGGPRPFPGDWAPAVKLQASFQPNASPYAERRRYLCWNGSPLFHSHPQMFFYQQLPKFYFWNRNLISFRHPFFEILLSLCREVTNQGIFFLLDRCHVVLFFPNFLVSSLGRFRLGRSLLFPQHHPALDLFFDTRNLATRVVVCFITGRGGGGYFGGSQNFFVSVTGPLT
jgi:hypothetical protein